MKSMEEVVRKMFLEEMAELPVAKRAASSDESMCASEHDGFACTKAAIIRITFMLPTAAWVRFCANGTMESDDGK